jgi:ABC-2 type transport system ATP-binding protein
MLGESLPASPPPLASDVAVRCRGLVKRYRAVVAVAGVDLEVRRGECFGLLGPNGAGKTTTLEILEGLTFADEGEVTVLGLDWQTSGSRLRQRLGIALQEPALGDRQTVAETLRLHAALHGRRAPLDDFLARFGLQDKRRALVGSLSGGQRQRLSVACALVGQPDLLILDEPSTGLDPQSRLMLWDQLVEFRQRGGTVLLSTHYMEEAERLCDRVAVIDRGKVIVLGPPAELVGTLKGANIIEVGSEPPLDMAALAALPGAGEPHRRGDRIAVPVASLTATVPALMALVDRQGARLVHFSTHRATLEDLFVSLTGRALRHE